MTVLGQLCLLGSLVAAGYGAFACAVGALRDAKWLTRCGLWSVAISAALLTAVVAILAGALVTRDFRFAYVAEYSSSTLPWHYSLSALWVGQAGSLLLWAWILNALALVFRCWPWRQKDELREPATGIVMGFLCFLIALMVFAADPMQATHAAPREGGGLSPLLQHPSMLIHPPIVFAGYALWAFPFALAASALVTGRLDGTWLRLARPWALLAWSVLGLGILLGAQWAYMELGWGGYWGWDPVENGSLIPWLTGTALVHGLMAWKHGGVMKKTTLALALATFGLCNFATFLTRSGVFSSVHAFSQSAIGWMFLAFMIVLIAGGTALLFWRRHNLAPISARRHWLARETLVMGSTILLVVLAGVVFGGTVMGALSTFTMGRTVLVGPGFYNSVLLPIGLLLLAMTAAAPLLRWRQGPTPEQRKLAAVVSLAALTFPVVAWLLGMRHPATLAFIGLAALVVASFAAAIANDLRRNALSKLAANRRQYGGFVVHVGLALLAVGIAGSSYGTRRHEAAMDEGETIEWAGREIRYTRLIQRTLPDKLVAEAELEIGQAGRRVATLLPARHLHLLQNEWTTEVAIHADWQADFYVILHTGEGAGRITLSLIENPLMRWIWLGAGVMGCGAIIAAWPRRQKRRVAVAIPPRKQFPHEQRRKAA